MKKEAKILKYYAIIFLILIGINILSLLINNDGYLFLEVMLTTLIYGTLSVLIYMGSTSEENYAGICGIICGILLMLSSGIGLIFGICLLIHSIIYLKVVPKNKVETNEMDETEYGQKVVYDKSFNIDGNNVGDNEESMIDKLPKDSSIGNICLIVSLISILFILMNLPIVSLILSLIVLILSIINIKKKEMNIYFSLIISIIIIGISIAFIIIKML